MGYVPFQFTVTPTSKKVSFHPHWFPNGACSEGGNFLDRTQSKSRKRGKERLATIPPMTKSENPETTLPRTSHRSWPAFFLKLTPRRRLGVSSGERDLCGQGGRTLFPLAADRSRKLVRSAAFCQVAEFSGVCCLTFLNQTSRSSSHDTQKCRTKTWQQDHLIHQ